MRILIAGASGYVGQKLTYSLAEKKHKVFAILRNPNKLNIPKELKPFISIIQGDLSQDVPIQESFDAAYFLVHSMKEKNFVKKEEITAKNFVKNVSTKKIIFLSGIHSEEKLSAHLQSRKNVEDIFKNSGIPTVIFRAGIIIGEGSASFEILRDLVEKLPIMVAPKWVKNLCQPIAIDDVIDYLMQAIDHKELEGRDWDIGGPDILSFKAMMLIYANIRHLKRWIIEVPVLTPRLSSYWLYLVTSTNFRLAKTLVDSLKHNFVCNSDEITKIVPKERLNYQESLQSVFCKLMKRHAYLKKAPEEGCFIDHQTVLLKNNVNEVLEKFWTIGGKNGWYSMNWAWRIRGYIDESFEGKGLTRGRRDQEDLKENDKLDFWRVLVADKPHKYLLLYAEMILPGEAWLEFSIKKSEQGEEYHQIATFRPNGIFGRLYWYVLYPFHYLIFRNMAKKITEVDKNQT